MEEIIFFEFFNGLKFLDSNVYEYKVGKEGIIKIDFLDSNGFVVVYKNNIEIVYIKVFYMKFCIGRYVQNRLCLNF